MLNDMHGPIPITKSFIPKFSSHFDKFGAHWSPKGSDPLSLEYAAAKRIKEQPELLCRHPVKGKIGAKYELTPPFPLYPPPQKRQAPGASNRHISRPDKSFLPPRPKRLAKKKGALSSTKKKSLHTIFYTPYSHNFLLTLLKPLSLQHKIQILPPPKKKEVTTVSPFYVNSFNSYLRIPKFVPIISLNTIPDFQMASAVSMRNTAHESGPQNSFPIHSAKPWQLPLGNPFYLLPHFHLQAFSRPTAAILYEMRILKLPPFPQAHMVITQKCAPTALKTVPENSLRGLPKTN